MQQYRNKGEHDGAQNLVISAEPVMEGEHAGLWHVVDPNGNHGHITDQQLTDNWTQIDDAPAPAKASKK